MNLHEYIQEKSSVKAISEKTGISINFLYQVKTGMRKLPFQSCLLIETATNGEVTCEELRPDIDWKKWSDFFQNRKSTKETAAHSGSLKD